jgi:DNA polymerase-1
MASTDEAHMMKLLDMLKTRNLEAKEEVEDFVHTLLNHRSEAKAHGTYVKGIAKRLYRGRVYSSFNLHTTTTGRLSSRNPNLQNIPRQSKLRRQFVPANDENLFGQVDYSQAELRVLSFLSGDQYFRRIFNDGEIDVFDDLTPILYPAAGTKEETDPAAWKELRIRIKAFVYGLGYGREHQSIAQEFKISEREALQLKHNFFEVIPEIVAFQEDVKRRVHAGEELITPFGRHRRFSLITKENRKNVENEALAFLPQSTASDMCLQALYWTRKEIRGLGWIRNIVHDSLLIEAPRNTIEECMAIAERNMIKSAETIVGDYVKFAVDSKIGKDWGSV